MTHHNLIAGKLDLGFSSSLKELPFSSSFFKKLTIVTQCLSNFLTHSSPRGLGLKKLGAKQFSVHVSLCGLGKIKALNREYREKDKATDVLSFPMYDNLRDSDEGLFEFCELGDIIICSPIMKKQAVEFSLTSEEEFFHLLVHGFLHLCGYDHEVSAQEERLMEGLEKRLIKNISRGLA
jgi:probable rRNA maturation factor